MKVEFLTVAQAKFNDARRFYEEQQNSLGRDFETEVRRAVERIAKFPFAHAALSRRTRRCHTQRFPYKIIYQILDDNALIVAVAHHQRRPDYWQSRLRICLGMKPGALSAANILYEQATRRG